MTLNILSERGTKEEAPQKTTKTPNRHNSKFKMYTAREIESNVAKQQQKKTSYKMFIYTCAHFKC